MAVRKIDTQALERRLDTLGDPEGAAWSMPARREALARLRAMGLPQRRDEYWRFTRPDSLTTATPEPARTLDEGGRRVFDGLDQLTVVFVDGRFDAESSVDLAEAGVEITRLADAGDLHWARDLYGTLEGTSHDAVPRPLAALNTAYATDGLLIRVTGKTERPIAIRYLHEDETSDAILHHVVRVERGAELTLLETGPAAARFNKAMEIDVADGGVFHHIRAQGRDHERRAATHMFARLGEGSVYKSFTLTVNGVLTRNESVVEFTGDNAVAHVAGAAVGDGNFHHDDTVFVKHAAVACESRQVFKKVLRNGATGVFQGKILVLPEAQQTDGYQISQSLLLDGDSQFLAKPELEIYADDVKCSHGSTSGAIDEEALFYLRARGIPRGEAEDLLTLAFLGEAIDEIDDESIAEDLVRQLEGWLVRRRS